MSVLTKSVVAKSDLTNSGWTRRARRIAFGGALGLALLAAFLPASVNRSAGRPGRPDRVGNEGRSMQPSELGYFGVLFSSFGGSSKDDVATFDREPPRNSLTAPPSGYQTPSAAQPYGLTKKDNK